MIHKFNIEIEMDTIINTNVINKVFEHIDDNAALAIEKMDNNNSNTIYTSYMFELGDRYYDVIVRHEIDIEEPEPEYTIKRISIKELELDDWLDRYNIYKTDTNKPNAFFWNVRN